MLNSDTLRPEGNIYDRSDAPQVGNLPFSRGCFLFLFAKTDRHAIFSFLEVFQKDPDPWKEWNWKVPLDTLLVDFQ